MPVTILPQVGVTEVAVESPSGQRWTYRVEDNAPMAFAETQEPGVYTVVLHSAEETAQTQFAVNLFSEVESDIAPQDAIFVGKAQIQGQGTGTVGRREWWRWPALAGLIVLAVEWWLHWRGRIAVPLDRFFPRRISSIDK